LAERVVNYKASVEKDLRGLGQPAARRVLVKIEKTLLSLEKPGEALSGEFAGLFKIRIGDYRVIFVPITGGYLVLRIAHRRDVYRKGRP
jgi:mRNA interferase RelE/StbE